MKRQAPAPSTKEAQIQASLGLKFLWAWCLADRCFRAESAADTILNSNTISPRPVPETFAPSPKPKSCSAMPSSSTGDLPLWNHTLSRTYKLYEGSTTKPPSASHWRFKLCLTSRQHRSPRQALQLATFNAEWRHIMPSAHDLGTDFRTIIRFRSPTTALSSPLTANSKSPALSPIR